MDTNVLISAFFWRGSPYRCLVAAEADLYELIISDEIISELSAVLADKFKLPNEEVQESISRIKKVGKRVEINNKLKVIDDDPDDDKFIETAAASNADFIVSGDKHLLRLKEYKNCKIVTVADFLKRLFT